MASTKEINEFITFIMEKRELSYTSAIAYVLGYVTQYVPTEEIEKAKRYM